MASGAGEFQIGRVNVDKIVAIGIELFQVLIAALSEKGMAFVAIIDGNRFSITGL